MLFPQLLSACLLVFGASAVPTPAGSHVLHEKREVAPRQWQKRSRVEPSVLLPVRIGLTQSNLDKGASLLDDVSMPTSHKYGQHLSAKEVSELFAPKQESVEAVRQWLHTSGELSFDFRQL